ncbi:MAG: hypothetical protein V4653_17875 [Pseudomonadota bacterium]
MSSPQRFGAPVAGAEAGGETKLPDLGINAEASGATPVAGGAAPAVAGAGTWPAPGCIPGASPARLPGGMGLGFTLWAVVPPVLPGCMPGASPALLPGGIGDGLMVCAVPVPLCEPVPPEPLGCVRGSGAVAAEGAGCAGVARG